VLFVRTPGKGYAMQANRETLAAGEINQTDISVANDTTQRRLLEA
jgi:hypothetical protein